MGNASIHKALTVGDVRHHEWSRPERNQAFLRSVKTGHRIGVRDRKGEFLHGTVAHSAGTQATHAVVFRDQAGRAQIVHSHGSRGIASVHHATHLSNAS